MLGTRFLFLASALLSSVSVMAAPPADSVPYSVEWLRTLSPGDFNQAHGVSANAAGEVYLAGYTTGDLGGANAGNHDAFVSKYDDRGALLWSRQFGGISIDQAHGVTHDGLGNVYVTGETATSLGGQSAGDHDAFLAKFDALGNLGWIRQFGTPVNDNGVQVATDREGNVYVAGETGGDLARDNNRSLDLFVTKYDADGQLQWTEQCGGDGDDITPRLAVDSQGNAYVSGRSFAPQGGLFTFLTKLNSAGQVEQPPEISYEQAFLTDITVDSNDNLYVTGTDEFPGEGRQYQSFVSKYDAMGGLQWVSPFSGSITPISGSGNPSSISVDGLGNSYVIDVQPVLRKFGPLGQLLWTKSFSVGSTGRLPFDLTLDMSATLQEPVYVAGYSFPFEGPRKGLTNVFFVKLSRVPEPLSSRAIGMLVGIGSLTAYRRRRRLDQAGVVPNSQSSR